MLCRHVPRLRTGSPRNNLGLARSLLLKTWMEHNVRVRRAALIAVLSPALMVHAGTKSYLSGKLTDVTIKDMTTTISIPIATGTGDGFPMPFHMGVNYQFEISVDDIHYLGSCWSKGKRNYASDWVVKDSVEFRVEKDKLFLRRPVKGELRLTLMGRFRVVSTKDVAGTEKRSFEPLPPFATRQIEPECH
jgi:hypothetical protein